MTLRNRIQYRCWPCVGNGLIAYPYRPLEICPDCGGTGVNRQKTHTELIKRYRRLRELGIIAVTAWYMAHNPA